MEGKTPSVSRRGRPRLLASSDPTVHRARALNRNRIALRLGKPLEPLPPRKTPYSFGGRKLTPAMAQAERPMSSHIDATSIAHEETLKR